MFLIDETSWSLIKCIVFWMQYAVCSDNDREQHIMPSFLLLVPLYYFHCPLCLTLCDMWALTMRRSFHTPKVSGISYRKRRTLKHSLKSFTSLRINYWQVVVSRKASQTFRWSVWWIFQLTNRPPDTPLQSNVWLIQADRVHAYVHMYGKVKGPVSFNIHFTSVV